MHGVFQVLEVKVKLFPVMIRCFLSVSVFSSGAFAGVSFVFRDMKLFPLV